MPRCRCPARPAAGLVTLAGKGYHGASHARTPYKGKNKPESQEQANRARSTAASSTPSVAIIACRAKLARTRAAIASAGSAPGPGRLFPDSRTRRLSQQTPHRRVNAHQRALAGFPAPSFLTCWRARG